MKALFPSGQIIALILYLLPFFNYGQINLQNLDPVSIQNYQIRKIHPVALKAMSKGLKPAKFKNVHVTYSPNVVPINDIVRSKIPKIIKTPLINISQLQKLNLQPDRIYVDPKSDLVFKPVKITRDSIVLIKPKFDEVFKDINLPEQTVYFNLANTDYALDNTNLSDSYDSNSEYTMRIEFKDTLYHFSKEIKKGKSTTKINFDVQLDGFIGITDPSITAQYSKNNGYKLSVSIKQKMDLKALSMVKLEETMSFPIWGYDIPIEDYGSCKIGLFLVFEANGEVSLDINVLQGTSVTAGIEGKTFYFVPRSMTPKLNIEKYFDLNYNINGKMDAFAGVDVTADMKYKSYDIMKLRARGGAEAKVEFKHGNEEKFDAELGARFLIDGKFEMKAYKKKFELYNKYYQIWKKETKNKFGLVFNVYEADAYYDRVWGSVFQIKNRDTTAFSNKPIEIKVIHPDKSFNWYSTATDKNGVFAVENVALKKGDRVFIHSKDPNVISESFNVSIPFTEIHLNYADYYTNVVEGSINSTISRFPVRNKSNTNQFAPPILHTGNIKPGLQGIKTAMLQPKIKITKDLFKQAITYKGDVQIIVEPIARKAVLLNTTLPKTKGSNKKGKNKKVGLVNNSYKKSPQHIGLGKNIKKPTTFKKVQNLAFGSFRVSNLNLKPGEKVKARINIDGFIVESNYIATDGLILTPIEHIGFSGGPKSPKIKAQNSFVILNAFRSNRTPLGKVHLVAGIDMKHTSPVRAYPGQKIEIPHLKMFPNAVHPLVYFDKNILLKEVPGNPGFAKAETGPWEVSNIYFKSKFITDISPIDGHRFVYVNYPYERRWVGIKNYQRKCLMCAGGIRNYIKNSNRNLSNDLMNKIQKQPNKMF